VQVTIRSAEVFDVRYDKGLQVKYSVMDEDQLTETAMVKGTLKPQFNHSRVVTFSAIRPEHLEFFESGFITFFVYGKQIDVQPDKRLMKMTTKVRKEQLCSCDGHAVIHHHDVSPERIRPTPESRIRSEFWRGVNRHRQSAFFVCFHFSWFIMCAQARLRTLSMRACYKVSRNEVTKLIVKQDLLSIVSLYLFIK